MAAEFVEPTHNKGENLDAVVKPVEQKTEAPAPQPQVTELPEKYKGKSVEDIIRMHQEAEKLIGRQGAEIGRLKTTHQAPVVTTTQPAAKETPESRDELDDVEFFANPKQAVAKLLEQHPALQELRTAHIREQQTKARQAFTEKHPDAQAILGDPEFQEWVTASRIRTNLLVQADQAYDVDAADELFSTWKERKGAAAAKQTQQVAQAAQKEALRAGIVPTGSSSPSTGDTGGKKIYRRADIQKLMQTDWARYEALEPEIRQAYAEGRVR